jgi:dTMP kinase
MNGKFVVIEGVDFTGKTTQSKKISELLTSLNIQHILTREPGGTKLGESVRDIILSSKSEDPAKEAILLLFMAARAENIAKIIKPALSEGKIVICDRFLASTIVYQGILSGFVREDILIAHSSFNYGLYPDLTILLDADPEILMKRREVENTERQNNKYDFLPTETIKTLRENFLKTAEIKSLNTKIVKSENSPEETFLEVKKLILNLC